MVNENPNQSLIEQYLLNQSIQQAGSPVRSSKGYDTSANIELARLTGDDELMNTAQFLSPEQALRVGYETEMGQYRTLIELAEGLSDEVKQSTAKYVGKASAWTQIQYNPDILTLNGGTIVSNILGIPQLIESPHIQASKGLQNLVLAYGRAIGEMSAGKQASIIRNSVARSQRNLQERLGMNNAAA